MKSFGCQNYSRLQLVISCICRACSALLRCVGKADREISRKDERLARQSYYGTYSCANDTVNTSVTNTIADNVI